jgi:MFS family permease
MVDRLGRRWTACICLAGACVAALGFAAAPADPVWSVVAACVFNAISVGGWNALDLLSAELFPTEVGVAAAEPAMQCCCWRCGHSHQYLSSSSSTAAVAKSAAKLLACSAYLL